MKHVIAFIKDRKLAQVTHALHAIAGVSGLTASSVRGFGRTRHAATISPTISTCSNSVLVLRSSVPMITRRP